MSVAHLLGLLFGVGLISISHSTYFIYAIFLAFAPLHFYSTLSLLSATQFKVLNRACTILLCEDWVASSTLHSLDHRLTWFGEVVRPLYRKSRINMASTIEEEFNMAGELAIALDLYERENYLIHYNQRTDRVGIVLFDKAETDDILRATLHAVKLFDLVKQRQAYGGLGKEIPEDEAYLWTKQHFPFFKTALQEQGWQTDVVFYGGNVSN